MTNLATSATAPALPQYIRKTLTNTFLAVGGMWAITCVASYFARDLHLGLGQLIGLLVASIACIFGVSRFKDSAVGLVLLAVFSGLEGVLLGPLLSRYLGMAGGAEMVMTAAGLTAAATFSCAVYSVVSRRSFSHLGGFLFAGLVVLLLASIASMFIQSTMLTLVLSGMGAMLFTAYLLYDISGVVTGERTNYIEVALSVYLDMLNLFLSLLRILGILGSSDD